MVAINMVNKKTLGIFVIILSLFKQVSAQSVSFYDSTIYRPISFGFLNDVHLWVLFATILLTTCIFLLATTRLPMFRDNQRIAIVFSLVMGLITSLATPASNWLMFIAGWGGWIILVITLLSCIFAAYTMVHKGTLQSVESLSDARSEYKRSRKYYKRERILEAEEAKRVEEILNQLESIPNEEEENYESEKKQIISEIEHVKDLILRNIRLDKKRRRNHRSFLSRRILKTDKAIENTLAKAIVE